VRGILIDRDEMVAEMHCLQQVCKIFLDGLPTVYRPPVRYDNCILRVERALTDLLLLLGVCCANDLLRDLHQLRRLDIRCKEAIECSKIRCTLS